MPGLIGTVQLFKSGGETVTTFLVATLAWSDGGVV
jgi:hypothetical protein